MVPWGEICLLELLHARYAGCRAASRQRFFGAVSYEHVLKTIPLDERLALCAQCAN